MTISFGTILSHLSNNTLPKNYQLKLPTVIKYHEFFDILERFPTFEDFSYFLSQITTSPGVCVKSRHYEYPIQTLGDFFALFSRVDTYFNGNMDEANWRAILTLLEKAEFTKANIEQILTNIDPHTLVYYYLPCKGLNTKDLLEIVNNPETFRKITPHLVPLLYSHFNPTRECKTSKTPLLQMASIARKAGHVFGLPDKIIFNLNRTPYTFDTQLEYAAICLEYLSDFLASYNKVNNSSVFLAIAEAIDFAKANFIPDSNEYKLGSAQAFYERYKGNNLTYFTSGWEGHSVGVALYGDYLVYSNRGIGGAPNSGCKIFKIKDTALITTDYITKLKNASYTTPEQFHDVLREVVDLKKPVASFPCKAQKYDTCSFVNPKNAIEAMIVLLQVGPFAKEEQVRAQFKLESDRSKYKKFTTFIRDNETDNLLKLMLNETNENLLRFYATLAKEMIIQHHGQRGCTKKDYQEFDRACYFFDHISPNLQREMLIDQNFANVMEKIDAWREEELANTVSQQLSLAPTAITIQYNNSVCSTIQNQQTPVTVANIQKSVRILDIT